MNALSLVYTAAVLYSRYYLIYHSLLQIVMGGLLGLLLSYVAIRVENDLVRKIKAHMKHL